MISFFKDKRRTKLIKRLQEAIKNDNNDPKELFSIQLDSLKYLFREDKIIRKLFNELKRKIDREANNHFKNIVDNFDEDVKELLELERKKWRKVGKNSLASFLEASDVFFIFYPNPSGYIFHELECWEKVIPTKVIKEINKLPFKEKELLVRYMKERYTKIVYTKEKYTHSDFLEVDKLVTEGHLKQTAAINTYAEVKGYKPESFYVQYYKRHANKKRIMKEIENHL